MERVVVPASEGRAVRVEAGQEVRVVDPEGAQVADLFAYCTDDISEYLSAQHTRAVHSRLFPPVGEAFVTNHRRPILTLLRDDSPGVHDMLIAACDPERYEGLGVQGWHASCQENAQKAMAAVGQPDIVVPQSVNLFMNIPVAADGSLSWEEAPTRPGDSVTLRAELACWVVVSACPQDIVKINAGAPGPITIEVSDPAR